MCGSNDTSLGIRRRCVQRSACLCRHGPGPSHDRCLHVHVHACRFQPIDERCNMDLDDTDPAHWAALQVRSCTPLSLWLTVHMGDTAVALRLVLHVCQTRG